MKVLVSVALLLTITAASRLPRGKHSRLRMAPKQILLPMPGADELPEFENSPLRRYPGGRGGLKHTHKNYLLVKKPSSDEYNNYDVHNKFDDKYNKYDKEYNQLEVKDNTFNKLIDKYNKLFNKNGMIYLTQPELDEDRKLNKLMNKVVTYHENNDIDGYLRKPLTKLFDTDEMSRLKKIIKAIKGEDGPTIPRTVYDFAELVNK